ncbi:hypothetical protein PF005_g10259 [Phytophthora fragariae]|uniref:Uncharacterized protein n=1 Tax=Phytophthora fragariae TaxID=53985 RepID=A0A6A3ZVC8_9STRA|nr:hypothetical protein PF003_g6092 [Phytophthora fragariae]KAE8937983.1 hypothetical protein PF009_g12125 [Phytophthora fragariae]KAE9021813.1 hypothetical protein PF011_g4762 [Phytophthora fragariae]KAE9095047.1 hypothetical protein PF007_g17540 [Phytophthora fragariae]KAE9101631.1 hypothetical protein PF006_g22625 [Phytophthora fragariae]
MFGVASALLMIPSPMMPSAPAYSSTTVASLSSPDDSGSASIAAGKLRCGMVDKAASDVGSPCPKYTVVEPSRFRARVLKFGWCAISALMIC